MTLRHLLAVLLLSALLAAPTRATEPDAALALGAPVTHSDWMLRPGAEWGPAGVRRMLDDCKAAGWSRVYWRACDGGRSLYRSRLLDPQGKWEGDSFWNPARPEDEKLLERFGVPAASRPGVREKLERL